MEYVAGLRAGQYDVSARPYQKAKTQLFWKQLVIISYTMI
jgi:hypothetical protein